MNWPVAVITESPGGKSNHHIVQALSPLRFTVVRSYGFSYQCIFSHVGIKKTLSGSITGSISAFC